MTPNFNRTTRWLPRLLALAAGLGVPVAAQQSAAGPPAHGTPITTLHSAVSLGSTGQVLPAAAGRSTTTPLSESFSLCWDNTGHSSVAGAFAAGDEIVDWGVKACLKTGVVRGFQIGYQTSALEVAAGGPGAALTVAFYEGTTGSGILGIETARYPLTGLPASPAAGVVTQHVVDVDLGNFPFCLADGEIGFGVISPDGLTQSLLTLAPNAALGTQDLLDQYGPGPAQGGVFLGSFDLGPGMPFGSLYLQVLEDPGTILADSTVVPGTLGNPLVFSELTPAVLGTTWLTRVDLSSFPTANFTSIVLTTLPGLNVPTAFGELLVDLTDPAAISNLSFGIHGLDVPKDTFILGQTFHAQAAVFRPGVTPQLTNGIDVVPGF